MAKATYNKTFLCTGTLNQAGTQIDCSDDQSTQIIVDISKSLAKFKGERIIFSISVDTSNENFAPGSNT